MNKRQRMYASNLKARNYLLNNIDASDVWFKRHTKRLDKVFIKGNFYFARDLFNLFDGIALVEKTKQIIFFQVKTNSWPQMKPILFFKKRFPTTSILLINVRKVDGRYIVFTRNV